MQGQGFSSESAHGATESRCRDAGAKALKAAFAALAGLAILATLVPAATSPAMAAGNVIRISSGSSSQISIAKGKPQTIRTNSPFYEIVVGDPDIANVSPLTDNSFYILGNQLGTTGIALFDSNRNLVGSIDIEVTLDTDGVAKTIRQAVPDSRIKVTSANGRLILSGEAKDAVQAEKARNIAKRFSGDEEIINSVNISSSQQVQLNVRVVEINRNAGHELGSKIGVSYMGAGGKISVNAGSATTTKTSLLDVVGNYATGGFSVDVAIKALEDRGLARRLAEPNLIARSGQTASFLAGGEYPIPTAADNNSITVEYKKYGVSLEFTPTVLEDGLISLDIAPEVSSVDNSTTYRIGDISLPAFTVRRAQTSIDLKSGQSFMMAGLLQSENVGSTDRVPGIGKLPVLGPLFSSKAYQRKETELVIIVTPYLVKPIDPSKKTVTPLDGAPPHSVADYFLGNVDEMKVSNLNMAKPGADRPPLTRLGHFLDLPGNQ